MAERPQRKQVDWVWGVPTEVAGFATTAASSDVVTTAISTALATASRTGGAVPVQVSAGTETEGLVTSGSTARAEIKLSSNGQKIDGDGNGNEVYGRLTEAAAVYTLSYFYLDDAGVEQAYTFGAVTNIDFTVTYRFKSDDIPVDAIASIQTRDVQNDPGGNQSQPVEEVITVTATNTFSALSQAPNPVSSLKLQINGLIYDSLAGGPVSSSGTTITWTPGAFGAQDAWDVETTDRVVAMYTV